MLFLIEHGDHCNFQDYTEGRSYLVEKLSAEWLTDDNTTIIDLGEFHRKCCSGESFQALVTTSDPGVVELVVF